MNDQGTQCDQVSLQCDCQSVVVKKLEFILNKLNAKDDRDAFANLFACTSTEEYMVDTEESSGTSFMTPLSTSEPAVVEMQKSMKSPQTTCQPAAAEVLTPATTQPTVAEIQTSVQSPQTTSQSAVSETTGNYSSTPSPAAIAESEIQTSGNLTQTTACQSVSSNWAQFNTNLSQTSWVTSPNPTTMPSHVFQDQTIYIPKMSCSKSRRRKPVFSPCFPGPVVEVMSADDMGHVPENAEVRIKPQLIRSCQQMSCSKGNFAWTLTRSLFKNVELEGRNFSGSNTKPPLSPRRAHAITHAMDDVYGPAEDNIPAARDAINSGLRSYRYHVRPLRPIQNFLS